MYRSRVKPRLYLETTIPSYLVARPHGDARIATDQAATIQWWDSHRDDFELFISPVVIREVSRGDAEMAALRLAKIDRLPVLAPTPASEALTERLLLDHIVPAVAADDAAHIALAAAHRMDFLLTWNCKHINNRFTFRRIERACAAAGCACPVIATPVELMNLEP
jgi:hypothetical protein